MANWAITNYVIEGPKEDLQKIYDAMKNHPVKEGSSNDWEGNILNALDIDWERHSETSFPGYYMRGFIYDEPEFDGRILSFSAEEAWGLTDFYIPLEERFPNIKVYWSVEERGCDVYATNDREGKYFRDRWFVDTCIDGNYNAEYFTEEKYVYEWLSDITNGRIKCEKDVGEFNESQNKDEDDFISIYEFEIIDTNKETQK